MQTLVQHNRANPGSAADELYDHSKLFDRSVPQFLPLQAGGCSCTHLTDLTSHCTRSSQSKAWDIETAVDVSAVVTVVTSVRKVAGTPGHAEQKPPREAQAKERRSLTPAIEDVAWNPGEGAASLRRPRAKTSEATEQREALPPGLGVLGLCTHGPV